MRRSRLSWWPGLALAAALAWPGTLPAQYEAPPTPAAYALQGVTVVNADGSRLAGVNVVVRRGLIEAMGLDVVIPPDARVLEGDSLFVYPGIVDAQGSADYEFPEIEVDRSGIASWDPPRHVQSFMPHRKVVDYVTQTGPGLEEERQKGLVAAAVHPEGRLMPGRGTVLIFRKGPAVPEELVVRPVLGPTLSFRGAQGVYPSTLFAVIAFYRQTFEDARHHGAQVAAYGRDPEGLNAPAWDPDLDVMRELMGGESAFFAVDYGRDIQRVLGLAEEYGFVPVIVGGDEAWKVADELKARGTPVLVSLDFPEPERWKPDEDKPDEAEPTEPKPGNGNGEDEMDAAAQREKQRLEDIYSNAGRLSAAGVPIALTSGGGQADILEGARKAIEYGLSEEAALAAITATPASLLGLPGLSRIEQSRAATFIVTDGPLFDEETTIRYTFIEGALEVGKKARGTGEAPAVNVTGTWEMSIDSDMGSMSAKMVLTQEGAEFAGTMQSDFGESKIKDGVVSGNDISFTLVFAMGGESMELEFTGTAEGDKASGSSDGPFGSISWTAKRSGPGEEIER
jgi:hypothetical protein